MDIARPSYKNCMYGNLYAFGATGFGFVAQYFWFQPNTGVIELAIAGIAVMGVAKFGYRAITALYLDYQARRSWLKTLRPATKKHDGRWATLQEIADGGMFEPKGRILGTTEEGYLLFIPHKLKPSFETLLMPTGGGKTSSRTIASSLLSVLISKRDRRQKNV